MPDSRRLGALPQQETVDRDGRAEALLVAGLEQYFSGRYEEAIHLWTRVLFLDRSHARARAYIDRARTALAERQRRADQILHETDASIARGDADGARELLTQAEAALADDAHAAGLRQRIERLEAARPAGASSGPAAAVREPVGMRRWTGRWLVAPVALVVGAGLALMLSERARAWLSISADPPASPVAGPSAPTAALTTVEVAMTRATTLMNRGRLAEALQSLERIPPESDHAAAANDLRLRIQQLLLADRAMRDEPVGDGRAPHQP